MGGLIDYYEVLQVHPKADPEVIEKAYKTLIAKHHPDKGGDTKFCQLLNAAHEVLCDPGRRAAYDARRAGEPEAHSRQARSRGGFETEEAAFAAGLWPQHVRAGFSRVWQSHHQWVDAGLPSSGDSYRQMRAELIQFAKRVFEETANVEGANVGDIGDALARSFPDLADTEALFAALLHGPFASVPEPSTISFPSELDRYYDALAAGRPLIVRGIGALDSELVFLEQLSLWVAYIGLFHPDHAEQYRIAAEHRYQQASRSPAFALLLETLRSSSFEEALSGWNTWMEGYSSANRNDIKYYPVLRNLGDEVKQVAMATGQTVAREAPRVAAGGCAGVFAVLGVLAVGILVLSAAFQSGDAEVALCSIPVVIVGVIIGGVAALRSGFKGGYGAAAGSTNRSVSVMGAAATQAATGSCHDCGRTLQAGAVYCPECATRRAKRGEGQGTSRTHYAGGDSLLRRRYEAWRDCKNDTTWRLFMGCFVAESQAWEVGHRTVDSVRRLFPAACGHADFERELSRIAGSDPQALMDEYGIAFDGTHYCVGPYRYDQLQCAIEEAERRRRTPGASPPFSSPTTGINAERVFDESSHCPDCAAVRDQVNRRQPDDGRMDDGDSQRSQPVIEEQTEDMWKCRWCGHGVPFSADVCPNCGAV